MLAFLWSLIFKPVQSSNRCSGPRRSENWICGVCRRIGPDNYVTVHQGNGSTRTIGLCAGCRQTKEGYALSSANAALNNDGKTVTSINVIEAAIRRGEEEYQAQHPDALP